MSGTSSYQSLVRSTFGFAGYLVLSALQFLYPFIGMFMAFHSQHVISVGLCAHTEMRCKALVLTCGLFVLL